MLYAPINLSAKGIVVSAVDAVRQICVVGYLMSTPATGTTSTWESGKGTSFTGTLNGTTSVTGIASTALLSVGETVTGTNIPSSTTITAIPSSYTITLSHAATGSGTETLTEIPSSVTYANLSGPMPMLPGVPLAANPMAIEPIRGSRFHFRTNPGESLYLDPAANSVGGHLAYTYEQPGAEMEYCPITATSSGTNVIVAPFDTGSPVAKRQIAVAHYLIVAASNVTAYWVDSHGTVLSGPMYLAAGQPFEASPMPVDPINGQQAHFLTGGGYGLNLHLSGAVAVSGHACYLPIQPGSLG